MPVFTDLNIVPCFGAFVKGKMRVYGEFAKKIMGGKYPPMVIPNHANQSSNFTVCPSLSDSKHASITFMTRLI